MGALLGLWFLLSVTQICSGADDITVSVFTVTSKSMTMQWSHYSGAISYRITATPKNSPESSVFAQYSGQTVMASLNSLSPNTVYIVRIEAMDNALNVLSSAETEDTTAPEVPVIVEAYSKHSDSITVKFGEVTGATSYILRAESDNGDFFSETVVSSSPGTIVGLQPYTEYRLSVMSVNAGGWSQPSEYIDARTVVMAPNLETASPDNATINVAWTPIENAVLYTLCIIQEGSSSRFKLNTTDTNVTFDDLQAGMTYCIKGNAWDEEGRAGDDLTVCQITRPPTPNVIHVQVTQGRTLSITVYWMSVQGAEGYVAEATSSENCTATVSNFCYINSVQCGQMNSVRVVAINSAGPSQHSSPRTYKTYPCPPENISVEESEAGNCSVVWSEVELADYYIAYHKRNDGTEKICNTTGTTCSFYCKCGYTYLTTVFPYNEAGSSPYANVRNYTTIPCCPEDVAVKLVSTETLEIMWSGVKGAELYETTATETDETIHCNDTAPVCALSDLTCNTRYSVVVTPCSELRGCNRTCRAHTHETAPCAPELLDMTQYDDSTYTVQFSTPNNDNTSYTITATGRYDTHTCHSMNSSCDLTNLPCGSIYEVEAVATSSVGQSLPGYSKTLETGPCCPASINVTQVTQAMTNVTWSPGYGARSYVVALTSSRGHAKCHTLDNHCLMGCITCGTNYSVEVEAISRTGHISNCKQKGFSSSACCPTNVKLTRRTNNILRVQWRSFGLQVQNHTVQLYGTGANYTCVASAGRKYCDFQETTCGDVYTVAAAPVGPDGVEVSFCQLRTFTVPCPGNSAVIARGRRSVA
ncbi:fibronectin type III domain-containing protein 7 [Synchiropus splendidus]|uniref:fibronectin type III domain-containing protein 7 n=1 Tax=Synchiropus splendidus TaxID=270530 RepID=UPI00237ED26D|nr:fibronectin type III domain-containing protein 7 [Synchiropus splendidus]